jgi:photosystem II stability/assembly factor-like uncharacterized protein
MNSPARLVLSFAAVIALRAPGFAADAPAAPAAGPIMIVNFTEAVPAVYGYNSWLNNFAVAPKAGFRVLGAKGAQGDGGFCQKLDSVRDLSKCAYIEIALAVQEGNEVPEYTIVLGDADGTKCWARVRVAQLMPGQPVWLRLKVADFAISSGQDAGADGKMDWSKVAEWHLQGDWNTKKPAQVLFIALRARP